jgi:outer membrane immunogenic protein
MKKIYSLAFAAASFATIAGAQAADIARPVYKAAPVVAPSYDWTGFYVGGHVGYGWGETNYAPTGIVGLIADPFQVKSDSWFGGVTYGYNYQFQRIVVGFEGEWSWSDINGANNTRFLLGLPIPGGATAGGSYTNNWISTASTRIGVAWDNLLVYGKAGVAWANNDYNLNAGIPAAGFGYNSTISETETGWLVGGGIEWGFAQNWSAKVEASYMDFSQKNRAFASIPVAGLLSLPVNSDIDSHITTVKFGVNYRFGDYGKAPVVAKY